MTKLSGELAKHAGRIAKLADMAWKLRALYEESAKIEYLDTDRVLEAISWLEEEETGNGLADLQQLAESVQKEL